MTLEELTALAKLFDKYGVYYEYGTYYDDNQKICGHWLKLFEADFETNEITEEEKILNNS